VRLGVSQGAVISISAGWGEQCFTRAEVARLHAALQVARHHRVTVVGSSGDFGTVTPCPGSGIA